MKFSRKFVRKASLCDCKVQVYFPNVLVCFRKAQVCENKAY